MSNYIDISDIEAYLGKTFTESTTPTDIQMAEFIVKGEADFNEDVGVFSASTNTDLLLDGHSFGVILPKLPVTSVTGVSARSGTLFDPTWTALSLDTDVYIRDANIGTVYLANPIIGEQNYKVSYVSGYSKANMPETIKTLVLMYTFKHAFQYTFMNTNGEIGGSEQIIDVDVYKEITRGGSTYQGMKAMDDVINSQKQLVLRAIKAFIV
jgi:hypothetical protein